MLSQAISLKGLNFSKGFQVIKNWHFLTILIVFSTLSSCNFDDWNGFFYPDKNNLSKYSNLGSYGSLESCRAAIKEHAYRMNLLSTEYDYECGKNCKAMQGDLKICSETRR